MEQLLGPKQSTLHFTLFTYDPYLRCSALSMTLFTDVLILILQLPGFPTCEKVINNAIIW